jgi:hypothetical protein
MSAFARQFFETGAQPVRAVLVPQGTPEGEAEKVRSFFGRQMMGLRNAWRVLVARQGVEFHDLTPQMDTLAMPELAGHAREQIAHAFGLPQTMLSDAANFATASQHDLQFWRNTILPRTRMIAGAINSQLFTGMMERYRLVFRPQEMEAFQANEAERAASLSQLVAAGLPLALGMEMLGYDLPNNLTFEQLSATIAEEKARNTPPQLRPFAQPGDPPDVVEGEARPADSEAMKAELRAWAKFDAKRGGKGRAFKHEHTPAALAAAIEGALEAAEGEARQAVFDAALLWEGYP